MRTTRPDVALRTFITPICHTCCTMMAFIVLVIRKALIPKDSAPSTVKMTSIVSTDA